MQDIEELFFEQLRISIGSQHAPRRIPSEVEWTVLFKLSVKQALTGVMLRGVEITLENDNSKKPKVIFEWIGIQQTIIKHNLLQNKRAKELYELFKAGGYRSCLLKGQGTALYYDKPELRQCGDIDLWVEGNRDEIVRFAQKNEVVIESVDFKDATIHFFNDVLVEVHFMPNCMYSPLAGHRLLSFFREYANSQFTAYDAALGFAHTTIDFDLVYSLVHIYRHVFSEGIGLRQLVDYYYILKQSNVEQRTRAFETICRLGMRLFTGGIMYILHEKMGLEKAFELCPANSRHGEYLLNEILVGGNFGHYDTRYSFPGKDRKFKRGIAMLGRNLRFVWLYPSEVLWSPVWKLWHWGWRKYKRYL